MNVSMQRVFYFPITRMILGIGICLGLFVGVQQFISKPVLNSFLSTKPVVSTITNYISVGILLYGYYTLFKWYEKRKITELAVKNIGIELAGGFLFGFGVLALVVFILYANGNYHITAFSGFSFMLAPFSMLVVAALVEEIFFRLIIYRIFENWLGTFAALFIISFAFEIPHLFNSNSTILSFILGLIFGFTHGIMYTYTKRIWLPFAFHLGWNFAQPFFGSNLSGLEDVGTIFKSAFNGPQILTGTAYGIEDSVISIILLSIIAIVFLHLSIKEGKIVKRIKS